MTDTEKQSTYVMRPTPKTLFFRTFVLWQFVRFILINLRMAVMLSKSHPHRHPHD